MNLTSDLLRALLHYDPETGVFIHNIDRHKGRWKAGTRAGFLKSHGYRYILIHGRGYLASRLAFLYMTGEWPSGCMDHINRNRSDDRWENLRDVNYSINNCNRGMMTNNKSGYTGVFWNAQKKKWHAVIRGQFADGRKKNRHLGFFDSPIMAAQAYEVARSSRDSKLAATPV